MIVCMQSERILNVVFKEWLDRHYPEGIHSKEAMAMAIYQFGQWTTRELQDMYDIDIEERGDEV